MKLDAKYNEDCIGVSLELYKSFGEETGWVIRITQEIDSKTLEEIEHIELYEVSYGGDWRLEGCFDTILEAVDYAKRELGA